MKKNVFLTLLLAAFLIYENKNAQTSIDDSTKTKTDAYKLPPVCLRATAGLGFTNLSVGAVTFIRLDVKYLFLSYRYCIGADMFPDNNGNWKSTEDYSWIAGFTNTIEGYYVSIGIGIGKVYTVSTGFISKFGGVNSKSDDIKDSVTGLPIQIDLFKTGKVLGGGLVLFANINKLHNIFGAAVCLQLGRLN